MRRRRVRIRDETLEVGRSIVVEPDVAHYLLHVLRCEVGQPLEVFDAGRSFEGTLVSIDPATVALEGELEGREADALQLVLYQAIAKGDRFELVLQKATELGVSRIVPLETARTVVRVPRQKVKAKLERWTRIVEGAARQSGRNDVPEVAEPVALSSAIAGDDAEIALFADFVEGAMSIADALQGRRPASVSLWVGPEGGFDAAESRALRESATAVALGPRVLRSETAGVVLTALVQAAVGDLR